MISAGYMITHLTASGARGPVEVVLSTVKKKKNERFIAFVLEHEPQAFYSVEDIRAVKEYRPHHVSTPYKKLLKPFVWFRKSK